MSEFADILEVAMGDAPEPRPAVRRFENSVHAFERALGGLVPPVGAHRASQAGAATAEAQFASYATRPAAHTRSWSTGTVTAAAAPAPRTTYA